MKKVTRFVVCGIELDIDLVRRHVVIDDCGERVYFSIYEPVFRKWALHPAIKHDEGLLVRMDVEVDGATTRYRIMHFEKDLMGIKVIWAGTPIATWDSFGRVGKPAGRRKLRVRG